MLNIYNMLAVDKHLPKLSIGSTFLPESLDLNTSSVTSRNVLGRGDFDIAVSRIELTWSQVLELLETNDEFGEESNARIGVLV